MSAPAHAATVVLARESARGPEIFMVQRHGKSAFMASAYVYPGGKLDAADCADEAAAACVGLDREAALAALSSPPPRLDDDAALPAGGALGLYVAALREVFEESGVLLARRADGAPLDLTSPETQARFSAHREAVHSGALSMADLAAAEGLAWDVAALTPFAQWITPVVEPRRFNARFFIARAPADQAPVHDAQETVDSCWVTPREALERYAAGSIQLAPPTLRTLEDMAPYASVDALIQGLAAAPQTPIMPRFEELDGKLTLLLPGDPLYPSPHPVQGPTRVQLEGGRWWSQTPPAP